MLAVVSLIFATGIFTGILSGTGMLKAMSDGLLTLMPAALGPYMAPATALLSAPVAYALTNDAFYFGVLPILANTASAYGITPAEMARALLDINYGDNQKSSLLWVFGLVLAMVAGALMFGVIPFASTA